MQAGDVKNQDVKHTVYRSEENKKDCAQCEWQKLIQQKKITYTSFVSNE